MGFADLTKRKIKTAAGEESLLHVLAQQSALQAKQDGSIPVGLAMKQLMELSSAESLEWMVNDECIKQIPLADSTELMQTLLANKLLSCAIFRFLRKRNVDINQPDKDGNYPLHMAVTYSSTELARALVAAGSPLNCVNKRKESVKDVIDRVVTQEKLKELFYEVCKIGRSKSLSVETENQAKEKAPAKISEEEDLDELSDVSDE